MDTNQALREHLVALLGGEEAHLGFAAAVAEFPEDWINGRAPNVEYTFWHLNAL